MYQVVAGSESPGLVLVDAAVIVVALILLGLVWALLMVDLVIMRRSRRLAKDLDLPKGQWLRPVKSLVFDPLFEFLAIVVVLAGDVLQNWEHAVAGCAGAIVGLLVGHYRYRIQYVRALPEYKSIIFVRSRAEYVALVILLVVDIAAEQHQIPVVGPLTLLITFLLALILFESIGRSWFAFHRYTQDTAGAGMAKTSR